MNLFTLKRLPVGSLTPCVLKAFYYHSALTMKIDTSPVLNEILFFTTLVFYCPSFTSRSMRNLLPTTPESNCPRTSRWISPARVSWRTTKHNAHSANATTHTECTVLSNTVHIFQRATRKRPELSHGRRWSVSPRWWSNPSPRRRREGSATSNAPHPDWTSWFKKMLAKFTYNYCYICFLLFFYQVMFV